MKLRNKKTGEIRDCKIMADGLFEIKSLVDLEGWEDYEEPDNNYWYIDDMGRIQFSSEVLDEIDGCPNNGLSRKLFGNYFETREEAEKAVEKLKAWKRLKDKGFRFYDWKTEPNYCLVFDWNVDIKLHELYDDLDLLFGGAE